MAKGQKSIRWIDFSERRPERVAARRREPQEAKPIGEANLVRGFSVAPNNNPLTNKI